ncbi:hypothetical protein MtrunA17_Chr7g0261861 [Medicago truncatula]|uniref:Uncharacterized protein n=1 Tax=Medicago truncatula TaxID=3880 RepID=A0A396H4Q8_MEDTR|nr:hypothetical protein MtrunA17_Chr7g0261861 [Medicago truncatula]
MVVGSMMVVKLLESTNTSPEDKCTMQLQRSSIDQDMHQLRKLLQVASSKLNPPNC